MIWLAWTFLFLGAVAAKECYVTPCTRDVVFALDSTNGMKSTKYVTDQINLVSSMTSAWTLSSEAARVAVFGYLFVDDYQFSQYYDTQDGLATKYNKLHTQTNRGGIYPGNFSEMMWLLSDNYAVNGRYPARNNIQKRIVVFTAETNVASISAAASFSKSISSAGFSLSIVSFVSQKSAFSALTYNQFFYLPLDQITTSPIASSIIDTAICNWDANVPPTPAQTCTTTVSTTQRTTPKTIKTTTLPVGPPTHKPIETEADYLNCSCYQESVWLDMMIAIDISASMGSSGLVQVLADISSFVSQMTIDFSAKKSLRVGLVTFDKEATLFASLTDITDQDDFLDTLWTIQSTDSEAVNIEQALRVASKAFEQGRNGVPDVIVIYSTAYTSGGEDSPLPLSRQLKESGIDIVTVACVLEEESTIVLKLGELATPRMNFTSYRNPDLIGQLQDAFCQCNCFCPDEWHQLVLQDRRFGECYFLTEIDSIWKAAQPECKNLVGNDGMLVYINSEEKELTIFEYAERRKLENEWFGEQSFHIGLNYDAAAKQYVWDHVGGQDSTYSNWDTAHGYPNISKGNCVKAVKTGFRLQWVNEDCLRETTKAMCMSLTCDTENYCEPSA